MQPNRIPDPRVIEAMEACRPGSDDLSDPGLAFLAAELAASPELDDAYERLQRVDSAIRSAFADVSVPDDLAARILHRLSSASHDALSDESSDSSRATINAPALAEPVAVAIDRSSKALRRWLLAGVGSVGLGVAVSLLAVAVLRTDSRPLTDDQVLEAAMAVFDREAGVPPGRLVAEAAPPSGHPFSRFVRQNPHIRWRWIKEFLEQSAVAYDLARPGEPRATLYVVRRTVAGLPSAPPARPTLTTHHRSVAAWQTGSLLYVLVVDGGLPSYRGLLNLPHGPLA